MGNERKITPVANTQEKYETYKEFTGKYKTALKNEFYFEAMLIDYAMLEDRLKAFLYYIGVITEPSGVKAYKPSKKIFKSWMVEYGIIGEKNNISLTNISHKRNMIKASLIWAEKGYIGCEQSKYLLSLSEIYQNKINISEFLGIIDEIDDWCEYRNEVIHSVMNKNLASLNSELADRAVQGMELARYIDRMVGMIKRGIRGKISIRRTIKLKD